MSDATKNMELIEIQWKILKRKKITRNSFAINHKSSNTPNGVEWVELVKYNDIKSILVFSLFTFVHLQ